MLLHARHRGVFELGFGELLFKNHRAESQQKPNSFFFLRIGRVGEAFYELLQV